jgi:DNA-binding MarR family transcriptional regulator
MKRFHDLSVFDRFQNLSVFRKMTVHYDEAMKNKEKTTGQLPPLTAAEYNIYHYILENYEEVRHMSIRELSKSVYSSTSTILRFVKKFGYDGYTEFHRRIRKSHDVSEIFCLDDSRQNLSSYFKVTSCSASFEKSIDSAAALLRKNHEVLFGGDSYGRYALDTGIRLFESETNKALYMDMDCQFKERRRGTCGVFILGSSTKEETESLRHTLPVGKIPLIVIYCGGQPLQLPCNMIDGRALRNETSPATSIIPAVHILEQLRKRMNQSV